jgi:circadian clock protein KaiB
MNDRDATYIFLLFVANHETEARESVAALSAELDRRLPGQYRIEIIDILRNPERADEAKVFATPMLVRSRPTPPVRILGDFSQPEKVISLLGLDAQPSA